VCFFFFCWKKKNEEEYEEKKRMRDERNDERISFHVEAVGCYCTGLRLRRETQVSGDTINWHRSLKESSSSSSSDSASRENLPFCVQGGEDLRK
jgi:hypothetical protein